MDDFTKTKLINNLIDLVDYFYQQKQKNGSGAQIKYLKGFCEGIAHTLVELGALKSDEAKRILKGLGKKQEMPTQKSSVSISVPKISETKDFTKEETKNDTSSAESLDVPTIFRKKIEKRIL